MISSILKRVFDCPHRRLTWPITPVRKPGIPSGETYVVCLDCARQFAYDWDRMRIGELIERSDDSGVLHPHMPSPAKTKMKYALIGCTISFAVLLGGALVRKRRARIPMKPETDDTPPEANADLDGRIDS
jgi:hypothetical protein